MAQDLVGFDPAMKDVYRGCGMTGASCNGHRKHTPIVSEKQRGFFGAEYARRKAGKKGRAPSITTAELKSHLEEAGGKDLPARTRDSQVKRSMKRAYGRRA